MAEELSYKRRVGDRKDGRQLRSLSPIYRLIPFIMAKKNDSCNQFSDSIEIAAAESWYRQKRTEGWKGMGMLHILIAAYVRTVSQYPGINRFIGGQRIFARNDIEVIMAVKRSMTLDGDETMIKIRFEPTDTVYDVYRKLNEKVDEIKANDGENNTETVAGAMCKLPRFLLRFAMWAINALDYFGALPRKLLDVSPFHGSMIITDLGSLGIPPVTHHLYNFGNLPVFLAFGAKRKTYELDKTGTLEEHKYIDYTATLDERTVDGFYYAAAFKHLRYCLRNPAVLETPPEKVVEDVF